MTVSAKELACLNYALSMSSPTEARRFAFADLALASSLSGKVMALVKDDKFQDGDLDLTTEEKAKCLECVKGHEWSIGDSQTALSLTEKLS